MSLNSHAFRAFASGWLPRVAAFLLIGYVVLLYAQRVIFPDISCDTINYHYFLGKSATENFPHLFQKAEFYPLGMHSLNPISDILNYLLAQQVGYRLGTALSMITLIGCIILTLRITHLLLGKSFSLVSALFVVPALVVHESLFQVATYFTDNLYAFLVLLSVFLILTMRNATAVREVIAQMALLGFLAGLLLSKLTNLIYVFPLVVTTFAIAAQTVQKIKNQKTKGILVIGCLLYLLALLPCPGLYWLDAYILTGNPIFPYYNNIFHSSFAPIANWAFNFGPTSWTERLFYPLLALAKPTVLGEVKDLFPDVKLLTSWLFFLLLLTLRLRSRLKWFRSEMHFYFIIIAAFLVWQGLFGYSRYGIALEYLIGIGIASFATILWPAHLKTRWLLILFWILSLAQSTSILTFNRHHDISWRPSNQSLAQMVHAWSSPAMFAKHTQYSSEIAADLRQVDITLQCISPSSAYPVSFPDLEAKPMLNLFRGSAAAIHFPPAYADQRDAATLAAFEKRPGDSLRFALVVNKTDQSSGHLEICHQTLVDTERQGRSIHLSKQHIVDNYYGDTTQQLLILIGEYRTKVDSVR